jgi:hypothetical protein
MAMTDHRSPAEIEREIEEERASLTGTLDELQNRFSFDRMTTEASHYMRAQSGEIMHAFSRAVRENPMAVAITGVGIAWMILGARRNGGSDYRAQGYGSEAYDAWDEDDGYGDGDDTFAGSDDYSTSTVGSSSYAYRSGTEDRYAGGFYDEGGGRRSGFSGTLREDDPDWVRGYADVVGSSDDMDETGYGGESGDYPASSSSSSGERMKDGFRRAGDRLRHGAEGRIEKAKRRLSRLRERLAHGTEDFSEESRHRVVAAREKAMEARHRLSREWDRRSRTAVNAFDRQPLAAGALAFAAGAAIAAALPRTRIEDEYLGDYSDRLMEDAERVFEEERAKLGRVARATAEEAKAVMSEEAGDVGTKARSAAERVAAKAKEEAEKEKLGQPGSTSSTTV